MGKKNIWSIGNWAGVISDNSRRKLGTQLMTVNYLRLV